MKIELKKDKCISAASCVVLASETFELDKEGIVSLKNANGNSEEEILKAAQSCPAQAIILYNDKGKQIFP